MEVPSRRIELDPTRSRFAADSIAAGMLAAMSAELGRLLGPATVTVDSVTRCEVEAVDADGVVFAQVIANTGEFTSAYRNRVTANMFKLVWVTQELFPGARKILCVTPSVTPAFTPTGWVRVAARDLGVEVIVYDPASGTLRPLDGIVGRVHLE
jgi:hypothetical protein